MGFEDSCRELSDTALWKLLIEKARKEKLPNEFVSSVGKICEYGVNLAKDIIRFFPTFTLHDVTHIRNVCNWIVRLLGDKKRF